MIETRKDWDLLIEATECNRDFVPIRDLEIWWKLPRNIMFVEGDNVGLATYEYPGMYSVHWYYQSARGRKAITLGKEMCRLLFEEHGAQVLRGLIKDYLKASRWACRQLGFKSHGLVEFPNNDVNELFIATKKEFLEGLKKNNNG